MTNEEILRRNTARVDWLVNWLKSPWHEIRRQKDPNAPFTFNCGNWCLASGQFCDAIDAAMKQPACAHE